VLVTDAVNSPDIGRDRSLRVYEARNASQLPLTATDDDADGDVDLANLTDFLGPHGTCAGDQDYRTA
jgi:hypothetical protein